MIFRVHELDWCVEIIHIGVKVFDRKEKDLFTDFEFRLQSLLGVCVF